MRKISYVIIGTAALWLLSLVIFLAFWGTDGQFSAGAVLGYGVWNLLLFAAAYRLISRDINRTLGDMADCIQSLIDGTPRKHFVQTEDSLPGKFQTQLLKLYDIMRGAQEEEERMRRELSGMVADLVHQVNTPLTNVQMYCGFLTEDQELPHAERKRICGIIDAQVEKLGWFADGFTKAARLEDDLMQMTPARQPILDMVLAAIDQISLKAEKNQKEIRLEGPQDISAVFDRRWTEEALFNLLDNAVKYGETGRPVTVRMDAYDLFVRIDVISFGTPIPAEEYNRLFQRFYRGSNAVLIQEGVGLGLYLTRKILSRQGGYVKVEKVGEEGNGFGVFLRKV